MGTALHVQMSSTNAPYRVTSTALVGPWMEKAGFGAYKAHAAAAGFKEMQDFFRLTFDSMEEFLNDIMHLERKDKEPFIFALADFKRAEEGEFLAKQASLPPQSPEARTLALSQQKNRGPGKETLEHWNQLVAPSFIDGDETREWRGTKQIGNALRSSGKNEEHIIDYVAQCYDEKEKRKAEKAERVGQIRAIIMKMIKEKRKPVKGTPRRRLVAGIIAIRAVLRMYKATYMRKSAVATLAKVLKSLNPDEKTKKRIETKLQGVLRPAEMDKVLGEVAPQ